MRIILILLLLLSNFSFSQEERKSEAYKPKIRLLKKPLIQPKHRDYPLVESLALKMKARTGDPFAQHELGLRYLLGMGMAADTAEAVKWIKKSADKGIVSAIYNIGILSYNGMSTDWNPFEAFYRFRDAADANMDQAQLAYGIFFLSDMVVNKNLDSAYFWINKAAAKDNVYAQEIIEDLISSGYIPNKKLKEESPVYVKEELDDKNAFSTDFDVDVINFTSGNSVDSNSTLMKQILLSKSKDMKRLLKINKIEAVDSLKDTTNIGLIEYASTIGSPEAFMLLGKAYEEGIAKKKSVINALACYVQAYRQGAQNAKAFIYKLIDTNKDITKKLEKESKAGNPIAKYAWAGMSALGFDYRVFTKDAVELMKQAGEDGFAPALIELGLCYYNGTIVNANIDSALIMWKKASELGSIEADVRIAYTNLQLEDTIEGMKEYIEIILNAEEEGSVLAMSVLANCYENGIYFDKDAGTAVYLYRQAASRGNYASFLALKSMHDAIRPEDDIFQIVN